MQEKSEQGNQTRAVVAPFAGVLVLSALLSDFVVTSVLPAEVSILLIVSHYHVSRVTLARSLRTACHRSGVHALAGVSDCCLRTIWVWEGFVLQHHVSRATLA